jgi:hypothetical protein
MGHYLLRRLLIAIPSLLGISVVLSPAGQHCGQSGLRSDYSPNERAKCKFGPEHPSNAEMQFRR